MSKLNWRLAAAATIILVGVFDTALVAVVIARRRQRGVAGGKRVRKPYTAPLSGMWMMVCSVREVG